MSYRCVPFASLPPFAPRALPRFHTTMTALTPRRDPNGCSARRGLLRSHAFSFPDILSSTIPAGILHASVMKRGNRRTNARRTSPILRRLVTAAETNHVHLSLGSVWLFPLLPTPPRGDAVTSTSHRHNGYQWARSPTQQEDAASLRTRGERWFAPGYEIAPRVANQRSLLRFLKTTVAGQQNAAPLCALLLGTGLLHLRYVHSFVEVVVDQADRGGAARCKALGELDGVFPAGGNGDGMVMRIRGSAVDSEFLAEIIH